MSSYNQEFNKDNVILRYIIVSLLAELKDKVYYFNRVDEDTLQKINVPFLYSVTGNERFLVDNFLYDALDNDKAIGDYEVVPRGVISLGSMSIDTGSMTNKFVRCEIVKEVEGQLKTYNVQTMFLPLDLSFNTTVICSNNLEMLKVTESIISKLYKATLFGVDLGMFRIESSIQVPEDYSQERPFEFGLNEKKEFQVTFDLQVKTFMPVFEDSTSGSLGSRGTGGVLLSEIGEKLVPNNKGVFQQFDSKIIDYKYVNSESITSNDGYIDPPTEENKGLYLRSNITSAKKETEDPDSKEYRNAEE